MGKISLFPSLTLSTLDVKEVAGGSKVLHKKPSKFKCWSLASGCGGHCSTEGESAGGVGFMPRRLYNRDPECHIRALQVSPQNWDRRATMHRAGEQRCQEDTGGAQDGGCPGFPWSAQRCSPGHQPYRLSLTHTAEARCSLFPLPLKTEDFRSWSETKTFHMPARVGPRWSLESN